MNLAEQRVVSADLGKDLVEFVRSEGVLARLRADWLWARRREIQVVDVRVERVNLTKDGGAQIDCDVVGRDGTGRPLTRQVFIEHSRYSPAEIVGKLRKRGRAQLRGTGDDSIIQAIGGGWLVRLPGFDERLPGLCLAHERAARYWPQPLFPGMVPVRADLLGHRLGRRAIGRIRVSDAGQGASMIFKCFKDRGGRHQRAADTLRRLARSLPVTACRIPAVLGVSDELCALFMEDIPAIPLIDRPAHDLGAWHGAGAALRTLHVSGLQAPDYRISDELQMLQQRVSVSRTLFGEFAGRLDRAMGAVRRELEGMPATDKCLIHRDFHEKQILVRDGQVWMIDFDTLAWSDPALDLGNLAAHIELNRLQGRTPPRQAMESFVAGYGASDRLLARTGPWTRAAMLRLACLYLPGRWRPAALELLGGCGG